MSKKIIFIFLTFLVTNKVISQEKNIQNEPFYINLFISADKTIYVETSKACFQEVGKKVSDIIRKTPFKIDQKIIYRIFADENLRLGYIIDVNREMLSGYGDNVQTLRYLLNTVELNIDDQKWFDSIDMKKLKRIN